MKSLLIKISVLVVLAVAIIYFQSTISPLVTAKSAVLQLEDSDAGYLEFRAVQKLPIIAWVLWWVIAGLMFCKQIIKAIKGDK